jgi:hypothetical protein
MPFIHRIGSPPRPKTTIPGADFLYRVDDPDSLAILKGLEVGDPLTGRVTRVLDGSRVLINLQGTEWVATTRVPMSEGIQIRGVVQAKGPPLIVKIVAEDLSQETKLRVYFKSLASRLLPAIEDHPAIALLKAPTASEGAWTEPLARWLAAFSLGDRNPPDPHRIRAALIHGGMLYERKLRQWFESGEKGGFKELAFDLKGEALNLLGRIKSQEKGAVFRSENAIRLLESLLGKIELFQTANWLTQKAGLGLMFQIPLSFGDRLKTADLLVSILRGKGKRKDGLRILLLLDMGELGHFQIDANVSRRGVSATIGVDREETVGLVRSMTEQLRNRLEGQGLTVLGVECFLSKKVVTQEGFFQQLLVLHDVEAVNIRV